MCLLIFVIDDKFAKKGLHQDTSIASVDVQDTWEPLEEGLDVYGNEDYLCNALLLQPSNVPIVV